MNHTWFAFDGLALTSQFVEWLAFVLDGTDHWWNLLDVTAEAIADLIEFLLGERWYGCFTGNVAVSVL